MQRFVACAGTDGQEQALKRLADLVQDRKPDGILFAGGILDTSARLESPAAEAQRHHRDMIFLEQFFHRLGTLGCFSAVIPGPGDVPLRAFLRAGIHAETEHPGLQVVHATLATGRDVAVSGIGGELTISEDSGENVLRSSRITADYFLRTFAAAGESQKVLLLACPPTGKLGAENGNRVVAEVIDTYHPKLCVAAGSTATRGWERVAHTTIVNPGRLADGSAAWIDWSREVDRQVELVTA